MLYENYSLYRLLKCELEILHEKPFIKQHSHLTVSGRDVSARDLVTVAILQHAHTTQYARLFLISYKVSHEYCVSFAHLTMRNTHRYFLNRASRNRFALHKRIAELLRLGALPVDRSSRFSSRNSRKPPSVA